jgi:hypothetical protein
MPVTGLSSARRITTSFIADVTDRKAQRAVTVALIIGAGYAANLTPIDTSFLINSQFRKVNKKMGGYAGLIGYTANYAAAVHDPANYQVFRRVGAEKLFLQKGFEQNLREIDEQVKASFQI